MLTIFIAQREGKGGERFVVERFNSSAMKHEESRATEQSFDCRNDCKAKATYYLQEANYDFSRARDMYMADLRAD